MDGDVSLQCEKGDVDAFFSSTGSSTIRAQSGSLSSLFFFVSHSFRLGDVKLSVIDTVSVRLNLIGKRVQVAEDAEHFHMETTKKSGVVQTQGEKVEKQKIFFCSSTNFFRLHQRSIDKLDY